GGTSRHRRARLYRRRARTARPLPGDERNRSRFDPRGRARAAISPRRARSPRGRRAAAACVCGGKRDPPPRGDPGTGNHARDALSGRVGGAPALGPGRWGAASDGATCETSMPGFCRDCRRDVPERAGRCSACGSPRVLRHPELEALAIAHVDCDAFYATIEKRDDPSLADQPVIVGGRQRGVVLTACYVARTFGVRSAMPMFEARRLGRPASIVRPDMEKYARGGRQVRELMFKLTPLVEPVSIDEAFMDLSGTARLHGMSPAKA